MLCLVLLLLAALGVGAVWGNRSLQVQEVAVDCPGLPAAFQGFRLAQVSDLHNAAFGRDNARLLAALAQAKPEIILLTGDLADSRRTHLAVALSFARQAAAIAPVYYVPGNHEARLAVLVLANRALPRVRAVGGSPSPGWPTPALPRGPGTPARQRPSWETPWRPFACPASPFPCCWPTGRSGSPCMPKGARPWCSAATPTAARCACLGSAASSPRGRASSPGTTGGSTAGGRPGWWSAGGWATASSPCG